MPTQTSIPIPPRLLIRCRRSERGNLEANVATTIRQKIAAHYITASTEFSNPGSRMRNSSFLIWVWLPLIRNSPFLIGDGLPPMRNTPFLIRVWLPLIWNGQFLIWSALSLMRNGSFLIRVCLPPMSKSRFLILGEGFPYSGKPPIRRTLETASRTGLVAGFDGGIPQLRKSRASNSVKAAVSL